MKTKAVYDIFISYRRDGGEQTAKIICDKLTGMGYRVFFDVESLRSGEFNRELYRVIEECEDVILVLSPGSLDRCVNEDDWVRQEIACALKNKKNVIPVMLRGFSFPKELPEDIDAIRWKNGLEASMEFFDAFLEKLTTFLCTKPSLRRRIGHNYVARKIFPFLAALAVVLAMAGGVSYFREARTRVYPHTEAEKNTVAESVNYVVTNLSYANLAFGSYESALKDCDRYLTGKTDFTIEDLTGRIEYAIEQVDSNRQKIFHMDDLLSAKLDDTPMPKDDFAALYTYLETMLDGLKSDLNFLSSYLNESGSSNATKINHVETLQEIIPLESDILFYGTNMMFVNVDESALEKLKTDMMPELTYIYRGQSWNRDMTELTGLANRAFNDYENKLTEIASYVGNAQQELDQLKRQLKVSKQKLEEKYAPKETDAANELWNKLLIFNSVGMTDTALQCLDLYSQKDTSPEAAVFVPAAKQFLESEKETGYTGGCLVGGYETPEPPHRQLHLGDIVVAVNGEPVQSADELVAVREKAGNGNAYSALVLRFDGDGYTLTEEQVESGQSRVLFYSLRRPKEKG